MSGMFRATAQCLPATTRTAEPDLPCTASRTKGDTDHCEKPEKTENIGPLALTWSGPALDDNGLD